MVWSPRNWTTSHTNRRTDEETRRKTNIYYSKMTERISSSIVCLDFITFAFSLSPNATRGLLLSAPSPKIIIIIIKSNKFIDNWRSLNTRKWQSIAEPSDNNNNNLFHRRKNAIGPNVCLCVYVCGRATNSESDTNEMEPEIEREKRMESSRKIYARIVNH